LDTIDCELTVIGAGMAGMAAALFAADRGLSVVQVGRPTTFNFHSGLLDLMAVHPVSERKTWPDPWCCIEAVIEDIPDHPYAKLGCDNIHDAFAKLDSFLHAAGVRYRGSKRSNTELITALGTTKITYKIPQTMWPGAEALEEKAPCLIADFDGLREFSARQIVEVCQNRWPGLRPISLSFPGRRLSREIITGEITAKVFEWHEHLDMLEAQIRPYIKDARAVGIPAVLGGFGADKLWAELQAGLGVPVFEIPMGPPSVPGLRLMEAFTRQLPSRGVRQFLYEQVESVEPQRSGNFLLKFGSESDDRIIRSKGVILATGRFLGNGLIADHCRIRERLFDLPVFQPKQRSMWHRKEFFDAGGHSINSAGLEIDEAFRPLDASGRPAFDKLYAAGSILAHQDWMRMKCGSGLAIATAFGAVNAFLSGS
jgi:glycerol-3-phosphate dehydrogenase subunit B